MFNCQNMLPILALMSSCQTGCNGCAGNGCGTNTFAGTAATSGCGCNNGCGDMLNMMMMCCAIQSLCNNGCGCNNNGGVGCGC